MTTDDKIRYGMMALAASSVVLAAFGHVSPLAQSTASWGA